MLGELTASIAHEVNQPLAAIATNGETGLRWLNRQEPDLNKAQDLMQRMVNDAYRAADIISRIRAMASHTKVEPQLIDLNACVEESVLFLQYELRSQCIQLEMELEPGLPQLLADRTQLQQVLINILVNAMQALSGKTSSLPKTMPLIHIQSLWLNQHHLQLQISDNGPGIKPEHLPHIFDSFFTTKSAGMGMGMGL
nr:ATP-binding protein [Rheinheimera faecalis]